MAQYLPTRKNRVLEFTPLEERFIREMIVSPDSPAAAAARAGYAEMACATVGPDLMRKPHIAFAIEKGRQQVRDELARQTGISLAELVQLLARIARFDPKDFYDESGNVLPIDQMPIEARYALEGVDSEEVWEGRGRDREHVADVRKLKFAKRTVYLDMLMRHLGGYELDNRQKTDPVAELIREINGRRNTLPIAE